MASGSSDNGAFDEYVVRVPKNNLKKYNVMRFSSGDQMDFQKWKSAKINRDLSGKKIYQEEEVYPEFGAGSEYGRKRKEEARKLKYGMRKSKFNVNNQPWKLSVSMTAKAPYSAKNKDKDKTITVTKDFMGKKEGGIGEGSMYFVFMQRPDCTFEAYPVEAWYNFTRTIKHRTLTDEEAEAEWDKRDKIMNHLNFMARKRLQLTEEQEEAEQDAAAKKGKKKLVADKESKSKKEGEAGLLIHDEGDDELLMSESEDSSDEEKSKKAKKIKKKNEDMEHEAPDEGMEDSDDGDDEGQEQDYNSDISSEEEITNDARVVPKGLDEVESSSSSEEEEEAKKPEEEGEKKSKKKKGGGDDASTSGESEVDSDIEKEGSALFMNKKKNQKGKKGSSSSSRSSTPNNELLTSSVTKNKLQEVAKRLETTGRTSPKIPGLLGKRQAGPDTPDSSSMKRPKLGGSNSGTSTPTKDFSQPQNIITEETVRRYLQHKPITTKDLLMKFKTKKTGLTREQIVDTVAKILKRLNPEQKKINGKIHLFLKQS